MDKIDLKAQILSSIFSINKFSKVQLQNKYLTIE